MDAWLARACIACAVPAAGGLVDVLMMHIAGRWFGEAVGWRAGSLTLLMPLAGSLGILALPDVPMAFATVLCLDAGARLLRRDRCGVRR